MSKKPEPGASLPPESKHDPADVQNLAIAQAENDHLRDEHIKAQQSIAIGTNEIEALRRNLRLLFECNHGISNAERADLVITFLLQHVPSASAGGIEGASAAEAAEPVITPS